MEAMEGKPIEVRRGDPAMEEVVFMRLDVGSGRVSKSEESLRRLDASPRRGDRDE